MAVAATQSCLAGPAKGDAEAPTEPNVGNVLGGVRLGEDPVDPPAPPSAARAGSMPKLRSYIPPPRERTLGRGQGRERARGSWLKSPTITQGA